MMKRLFYAMLFCLSFTAYADGSALEVDASQPSFVVALDANASTGYSWRVVQYDTKLLTLADSSYQKSNSNLIGSGGLALFTFNLKAGKTYPKQTNMVFSYDAPGGKAGTLRPLVVRFVGPM